MTRSAFRVAAAAGVLFVLVATASAQTSKSVAVGKELAAALDAKKLDAIAARHPTDPERFVAALYFPGVQLLVVSGKYPAPVLMEPRLTKKEYRDVYIELSGTAAKDTKIFVLDMGAPGLSQKRVDGYFDTWNQGEKHVVFDGNWDAQKVSEADYNKMFTAADEEYAKILATLLAEAKK